MIARALLAGVVVGLVLAGEASAASGWTHVTIDRRAGAIEATLSYDDRSDPAGSLDRLFTHATLVVRRANRVVAVDRINADVLNYGSLDLRLRDVWGDRAPEALVQAASCGNRCGVQLFVALIRNGTGKLLFHDFGGGWGGARAWTGQRHRGRFYFVSDDQRFFCTFASCASSFVPLQLFAIDPSGRRFVDVTRSRGDAVEVEASGVWKAYLHDRQHPSAGGYAQAEIAAWCADQYLLGRKPTCDRALRQGVARGYLPSGRTFIRFVESRLAAWGYG